MKFRIMEYRDIPDIVEDELRIFGQSLGFKMLEEEVNNPNSIFYVCEDEGKLIGYIGIWLTPPTGQILNFYIKEEHQGKKIGSKLLNIIIEIFKNNDVNTITLEVRYSNKTAINLYTKYGFSPSHRRKMYYKDGEDALVMIRRD